MKPTQESEEEKMASPYDPEGRQRERRLLRDESTPEGKKIWADVEKAASRAPRYPGHCPACDEKDEYIARLRKRVDMLGGDLEERSIDYHLTEHDGEWRMCGDEPCISDRAALA